MAPALSFNAWLRHDAIFRELEGRSGRLLEVGCGQGGMAARLAERFEYVGYEPDPVSHACAERRLRGRGRVINAPLPSEPDRPVDVICAFEVLEHIEDDAGALRAWREWLRPGGLLLLSVPAHPSRFAEADEAVGHYRRYDRAGLERLLRSCGYDAPRLTVVGFPLGYLLEPIRNAMARRRPPASMADRTAGSGRWAQPADSLGWATRLATLPFRVAQRPFARTGLGTGIVAAAVRAS